MTWTLLRVFFKERFGFQRLFGQRIAQSFWKKGAMILLLVYAFGVTSFSIGFLNASIAETLPSEEQGIFLLQQVFSYVVGIGFLFSFFQARGSLYAHKDFDILGALPISSFAIIRSKFFMMYLFIFGFSLLLTAPLLYLYVVIISPNFFGMVMGFFTYFFLPLPVMAFGAILSMGIYQVTAKWMNPKIVQTLLMMLFLILYLGFSLLNVTELMVTPDWVRTLLDWYVPTRWFVESFSGIVFSSLLLLATHSLVLGLFLYGLHHWMYRLNQMQNVNRFVSKEKIPKKEKWVIVHLIEKEWKRYIQSPIYILNTGFGLLLFVIVAIVLLFLPNVLIELQPLFEMDEPTRVVTIVTFTGFVLSTFYTPAISLSLEGKNINLLKHLPIHPLTISLAKILFNIVVGWIPVVIGWAVFAYVYSLTTGVSFLTLALLLSMLVFMSIVFYWINLLFPRFDFQQDVEIVKQSVAALVAVFGGFAIVAGIVFLLLTALIPIDFYLRLIVIIGLIWLLSICLFFLLKAKVEKFFKRFSI